MGRVVLIRGCPVFERAPEPNGSLHTRANAQGHESDWKTTLRSQANYYTIGKELAGLMSFAQRRAPQPASPFGSCRLLWDFSRFYPRCFPSLPSPVHRRFRFRIAAAYRSQQRTHRQPYMSDMHRSVKLRPSLRGSPFLACSRTMRWSVKQRYPRRTSFARAESTRISVTA